ncbi:MAG: cation:dicarboxylase symporter family transporter, partial [Rickettsiales bacterium]
MIILYIIFGILIKLFAKISPIPFYKKSIEYQAIAFSSSSSKIALPVTIDVCEHKLGASKIACRFILPLGASINMCGLAIHLSLTTIFFAQMFGVDLSIQDYIIIIITSTFGSIGGAGVPGSALVMLPLVMSSINLPIEQIAIVAGVDRFLDMIRTTINITGDAAITIILDARMKTLNLVKYYKN